MFQAMEMYSLYFEADAVDKISFPEDVVKDFHDGKPPWIFCFRYFVTRICCFRIVSSQQDFEIHTLAFCRICILTNCISKDI